jgi:ABC-type spermidine/putrescine transport system permease subunit II
MDHLPNPFLIPAGGAIAAAGVGIAAAFLRTRGRATALIAIDTLILFPALLPVEVVANLLMMCFGAVTHREWLWLVSVALVSIPLAYLPPRIAFAGTGRTWPALTLGALLAFARVYGELVLAVAALDRFTIITASLILISLVISFLIARLISSR